MTEHSNPPHEAVIPRLEDLDPLSRAEDLALAFVAAELEDPSLDEDERRVLVLRNNLMKEHLAGPWYKGTFSDLRGTFPSREELNAEAQELEELLGVRIGQRQQDASGFMYSKTNEARWKLSGLDKDAIAASHPDKPGFNTVRSVEQAWSEASEARINAQRAQLTAEMAEVVLAYRIAEASGEEGELPERYYELGEQLEKLQGLNRYSSGAGWGSPVPGHMG